MTAEAFRNWWNRLAALPWRRAVPAVLRLTLGLALLTLSVALFSVGMELGSAGVSGFAETDLLLIEAEAPFTTADLTARNLGIGGIATLELPDGEILRGDDLALFIEADSGVPTVGADWARIESFEIGSGSRVSLEVNREERRLNLVVEAEELHFRLTPPVGALVSIDGGRCPATACDLVFAGPRPIHLTAGGEAPLKMSLDLEERNWAFTDRVAVSRLRLWESELLSGKVERWGAVRGGSLRFLEAPAKTVPLEQGTVVDLDPAGLILRALAVREEAVFLQLSGRVEGASLQIGDAGHSLMPTWFDWLSRSPVVQFSLGLLTMLLGGGLTLFQSLARSAVPRGASSETSSEGSSPAEASPGKSPRSEAKPASPEVGPSSAADSPTPKLNSETLCR